LKKNGKTLKKKTKDLDGAGTRGRSGREKAAPWLELAGDYEKDEEEKEHNNNNNDKTALKRKNQNVIATVAAASGISIRIRSSIIKHGLRHRRWPV
jgi:hypothetical protein